MRGITRASHRNPRLRYVLAGSARAAVLKACGSASWLLLFALVGRKLGAEALGRFGIAYALMMVCSTFCRLGLENVVVANTARLAKQGELATLRFIWRRTMLVVAGLSVALSALLTVGSTSISGTLFGAPTMASILTLMAFALPGVSVSYLQAHFLRGAGRIGTFQLCHGVGAQILTLLLSLFLIERWGVIGVGFAYLTSTAFMVITSVALWYSTGLRHETVLSPSVSIRSVFSKGLVLLPVTVSTLALQWIPILLLGLFVSSEQVGFYQVALRLANILGFIVLMINASAAPSIARLEADSNQPAMASLSRKLFLFCAFAVSAPATALIAFPETLLGLFGTGFGQAAHVLVILAVGQLAAVIGGLTAPLLMMTGHESVFRNLAIGSFVTTLGLSLLLIPWVGAIGAAISVLVTRAIRGGVGLALVRRHLGFWAVGAPG